MWHKVQIQIYCTVKIYFPIREVTQKVIRQAGNLEMALSCNTSPAWQFTTSAWASTNVDTELANWASTNVGPSDSFANKLGSSFGDYRTNFQCGISLQSQCTISGCLAFENTSSPAWSYLALGSIVNLDTVYNELYDGLQGGLNAFNGMVDVIPPMVFPWSNPTFAFGSGHIFLESFLTTAAAFARKNIIETVGFSAFFGGALQEIAYQLEPDETAALAAQLETTAEIKYAVSQYEVNLQNTTTQEAKRVFGGAPDQNGNTILNYLKEGSFVDITKLPTQDKIQAFYTKQLIGRFVTAGWREKKIFAIRNELDNSTMSFCPNTTRYYNETEQAEYCTYFFYEYGVLRGYLDDPPALSFLQSNFSISGNDISASAAAAFSLGGLNFTQDMAYQANGHPVYDNGSVINFDNGAANAGTFNIPVCDAKKQWSTIDLKQGVTQFGNGAISEKYGMLPCCCGPDCADTAKFIELANLSGFQTLLRGCKSQLAKSTGTRFNDIDYGYKISNAIPYLWAIAPLWKQVLITIACIFAFFTFTGFCGAAGD
ncbi:hypothetical protein TWF694_006108 [Orbilia ellipsospora]|uniref:Uncharacterized protein n=1 Tax=Orbilia ellipsospora TaxID=2528407 RepID=A0AAV9WXC9_9PEZI